MLKLLAGKGVTSSE